MKRKITIVVEGVGMAPFDVLMTSGTSASPKNWDKGDTQ
jgi:hypothetical protein